MSVKNFFMILLAAILLALASDGSKWQGTGTMSNQVLAKIWENLSANIDNTFTQSGMASRNNFVKDISDRLNAEWDPAWNVIMVVTK